MRRTNLFSLNTLRHLQYLPSIIAQIKNWPLFILNYTGFIDRPATYFFRNGTKLKTNSAVDTATITVIFIKKNYGTIPDNAVIVDIGANIGVFSIYAVYGKNNKIFAYEPAPENFKLLQENISLNKLDGKVKLFNLGVGARSGSRPLYLSASPLHSFYAAAENQRAIEVNCITLGDIFTQNGLDRIDLLKLDCEGAEFEILYNTSDEYFKKIKEIRMEYHNHGKYNILDLEKSLETKGFLNALEIRETKQSGIAWFVHCGTNI